MALDLNYSPRKVVDIANLSRKDWLIQRKKGLGGSDIAAVFGVSKWKSALALYYDKTSQHVSDDEPENWFRLEVGHVLEPLLRKSFAKQTGFEVLVDTWMYQHPLYPFMIADLDLVCFNLEKIRCGGELKSTDEQNLYKWSPGVVGEGGKLPIEYELQVRHYMAVMNLDIWYVTVCWGFSEDKTMTVIVNRDLEIEETIIAEERKFWIENVEKSVQPKVESLSDAALKQIREIQSRGGCPQKDAPPVMLDPSLLETAKNYLEMYDRMKVLEDEAKQIKEQLNAVSLCLTEALGDDAKGLLPTGDGETMIEVSYSPQERSGVDQKKLQVAFPDAYRECATTTLVRPFRVTQKKLPKGGLPLVS